MSNNAIQNNKTSNGLNIGHSRVVLNNNYKINNVSFADALSKVADVLKTKDFDAFDIDRVDWDDTASEQWALEQASFAIREALGYWATKYTFVPSGYDSIYSVAAQQLVQHYELFSTPSVGVRKVNGKVTINDLTLAEALNEVKDYFKDQDRAYVTINWANEEIAEYSNEEIYTAFWDILGDSIDFPSASNLDGNGITNVFNYTQQAIRAAYRLAEQYFEDEADTDVEVTQVNYQGRTITIVRDIVKEVA